MLKITIEGVPNTANHSALRKTRKTLFLIWTRKYPKKWVTLFSLPLSKWRKR